MKIFSDSAVGSKEGKLGLELTSPFPDLKSWKGVGELCVP